MVEYLQEERSADRKSTRLNSRHNQSSYAVFRLKKKKNQQSFTKFILSSPQQLIQTFSTDLNIAKLKTTNPFRLATPSKLLQAFSSPARTLSDASYSDIQH